MRQNAVGRHWKPAKCFRRKNSLRTSIITSWSNRFNDSAIASKTIRAAILRLKACRTELIERFSKRHREIDEKTKELLEREPEKANQNIKVIRANIAHKERARKIKDVGMTKLQSIWNKQLSWGEWWQVKHLAKGQSPEIAPRMTAARSNRVGGKSSV